MFLDSEKKTEKRGREYAISGGEREIQKTKSKFCVFIKCTKKEIFCGVGKFKPTEITTELSTSQGK